MIHTFTNVGRDVRVIAEMYKRMECLKFLNETHEITCLREIPSCHADGAFQIFCRLRDFHLRLVDQRDDLFGASAKKNAFRRQCDLASAPIQERDAHIRLEVRHLARQRRLRDVEAAGRLRDALLTRDHEKIFQHTDFHGNRSFHEIIFLIISWEGKGARVSPRGGSVH